MKKILLTGYYGQDNLGDDYIFYSLLDCLVEVQDFIELTVEVGNKYFDNALYESLVQNYKNIKIKYLNTASKTGKLRKLSKLTEVNYWIIGGGGLFASEDISRMKHMNTYLRIARLNNVKICMYGIDIDSLSKSGYINQWKKTIDLVDFIETRNSTCASGLQKISDDSHKIIPGVDLTQGFYTKEEKELSKSDLLNKYGVRQKYMIWALAMPWSKQELMTASINKRYKKLCSQFQHLLLHHKDIQHVFLPFFGGTDIDMIHDVIHNSGVNYIIIPQESSIGEKRYLFKFASGAVVMRFHGVQFALFHSTPFIAVSYSPKTSNILKELKLSNRYVELGIRSNSCFMKEFDIPDASWKNLEDRLDLKNDDIRSASDSLKMIAKDRQKYFIKWIE